MYFENMIPESVKDAIVHLQMILGTKLVMNFSYAIPFPSFAHVHSLSMLFEIAPST